MGQHGVRRFMVRRIAMTLPLCCLVATTGCESPKLLDVPEGDFWSVYASVPEQETNRVYRWPDLDEREFLGDEIGSFASESDAESAVKLILRHTGLKPDFTIRAGNVKTATVTMKATASGWQLLILYNQEFMKRAKNVTKTDWSTLSILAHEIGHYLNGHTFGRGNDGHAGELDADEFSGFILSRMGADLKQAQVAMEKLGSDSGSATHPPKSARLAAIAKGWKFARESFPRRRWKGKGT